MRVGIIGLGRMGEGMSRRMIKEGIETYGYRRNYAKAKEAEESGYITAAADSLESPCSSSKERYLYTERNLVRQSIQNALEFFNLSFLQN